MTHNESGFIDKGPSLRDLLGTSSTWEAALVPIGPAFRIALAGLSVASLIAAVVSTVVVTELPTEYDVKPGLFLAAWPWFTQCVAVYDGLAGLYVALTVLCLVAGVLTEGFALAGPRVQIGLGVIAVLALVALLPAIGALLIAAGNVTAWVIGACLVIALGILLLIALLDGL